MRIGVAIPCFIKHIDRCYELLDSINQQTRLPDQVVVSCSSSKSIDFMQKEYKFPLTIITTEERKNAAQNRNIAASNLNTDIITFFDADDIMHPQRIKAIEIVFQQPVDILLHSYYEKDECRSEFPDIKDVIIENDILCICYSGCITFKPNTPRARIHHGQASVTRRIFEQVKFPEETTFETREDCVFCRRIFELPNIRSSYIRLPLSKYYQSNTCITEKEALNK
jgi:glycosyltransferase involved in cell wall biosynthesis